MDINKKYKLIDKVEDEHVAFFNKFGFIHYQNFIPQEQVQRIISSLNDAYKKLVAENQQVINGIPIHFGADENENPIVHRLPFSNLVCDEIEKLYQDPRFKMLGKYIPDYESRLGLKEKDGVVTNYYINTEKSNFRQMGWHTDVTRDVMLGRKLYPMINIGVYLDDSGEKNGGLRIVPGSQHQSVMSMLFTKAQFVSTKKDPHEIMLSAKAGDLTLHDGRTWHRVGKSPNQGAASRRRVMYVPLICGPVKERQADGKTPFYHKLNKLATFK
jgi:phytanoyl-CoA hydroxylase